MKIKTVTRGNMLSWVRAVYDALDEISEEEWQDYYEDNDQERDPETADDNRDNVMTAMAFICEELGIDQADI